MSDHAPSLSTEPQSSVPGEDVVRYWVVGRYADRAPLLAGPYLDSRLAEYESRRIRDIQGPGTELSIYQKVGPSTPRLNEPSAPVGYINDARQHAAALLLTLAEDCLPISKVRYAVAVHEQRMGVGSEHLREWARDLALEVVG